MATNTLQHKTPKDMMCPALQLTDGCTHGKCRFCDIFNGVPFSMQPMDEILADLDEIAKTVMPHTHRICFTGGNPFALATSKLIEIMDVIEDRIPHINQYGGFCRIMDIANKTDEELALLASRGVSDLAIGAESGYDPALEFMQKGCTAADIVEQAQRLHKAGITFTFFYLTGMAGAGKGQENAIASAEVFSKAAPQMILIMTLVPTPTWPLAKEIAEGSWIAPGEKEMSREIQTFIKHLNCETYINSSHDSDIIRFEGMVPKDQANMVELLEHRIEKMNEASSRKLREFMHKGKLS